MWRLETLKALIRQRLSAAVDDILGHVDRAIRELEEEERTLQDGKQLRTECPSDIQEVVVNLEEVLPGRQQWSPRLDQEDLHIKEEQKELWSSQEEPEILQEAAVTEFTALPHPLRSRDNEEKSKSSQRHRSQTDESRGGEPLRIFGSDRHLHPVSGDKASASEVETKISDDDYKQTREAEPVSDSLKHSSVSVSDAGKKFFICCECGRKFGRKDSLRRHVRFHTGEKPYACSVCGKRFSQRPNLIRHMRCHSGEKPFSCSFCDTSFAVRSALVNHMRIHTGEKPFSCLHCEKSFTQKGGLKKHMTVHTGEKPYSCPVCEKSFSQKGNMMYHFSVHTGQKQFSCSVCDKRFTWQSQVKSHKCVGESST